MIGRDRELGLAEDLLAQAEGRFGVVVLEGEAGIGKTTIWRELVRRADERGLRVLACRPAETEAKLGFTAIGDLLEAVPDGSLRALPDPTRHALEVALLRVEPGDEALDERRVAAALRALLESLAAEDPLIVAVDDVQWVDGASATALAFALRRLTESSIGWLLSPRSGEPAPLAVERTCRGGVRARARGGQRPDPRRIPTEVGKHPMRAPPRVPSVARELG